jgi:hypothetical protein
MADKDDIGKLFSELFKYFELSGVAQKSILDIIEAVDEGEQYIRAFGEKIEDAKLEVMVEDIERYLEVKYGLNAVEIIGFFLLLNTVSEMAISENLKKGIRA